MKSKIYPKLPVVIEIKKNETKEIVEKEVKMKENKKEKKRKQRNEKAERRVKIVGDSIVHSMDFDKVEKVVGKVSVPGKKSPGAKHDRAYGSKYDPKAQYPNNNQEYKNPQLLAREKADILVFQASVTDITNLRKISTINVNSTYEKAVESSESAIKTATKALDNDVQLQVILMQRPARYDSMADVSEWANFVLSCKVEEAKKQYGDRLVLGEHSSLHTEGAVEARYGMESRTPGYDGVHLRGAKGQEAYTDSVIAILRKTGLCSEQWQVVGGKTGSRRQDVREQEVSRQEVMQESRVNQINISNRFEELN